MTAEGTGQGPEAYSHQDPPAGRARPPDEVYVVRVLCRDRLGVLIHEYSQVA